MADEFTHKDPGSALTQAEFITSDGTGHVFESQAQGDILYATSTTVLKRLGKDANSTRVLTNTGTSNNPTWAQVTLTSGVTGTLPVANGGTNATSLTDKAVLISQDSGTDTVGSVALSSSGQIIIGGSSGPEAATLTAGTNVTITNGDGSISIAASGSVVREGGQTSEATSTSTSSADMLTAGSLTVQVTDHYMYSGLARKTTGASATMNVGIKQNSTETRAAENSGNKRVFTTGAGNVADTGMYYGRFGPRIANYRRQGQGAYISYGSGTTQASGADACIGQDADSPLAEVTQVILSGITTSASITIALDELQIYSHAAS